MVSYGPEACGEENEMGVYTRVEGYEDWILRNLPFSARSHTYQPEINPFLFTLSMTMLIL